MTKKPTYEELQQRIKGLEKEAVEHKRAKEELQTILNLVFNCKNNSYMLCSWAGGEDYAQELPCSSLFRKRSSTG